MKVIIYAERFALSRRLYRYIRRQVKQCLAGLSLSMGRAVVSIGDAVRGDGSRKRCRVELEMSGRPVVVSEETAESVAVALKRCLEALAFCAPEPGRGLPREG